MSPDTGYKTVNPDAIIALENAIAQGDLRRGRLILEKIAVEYGYGVLMSEVFEPILADMGEHLKRREVPLAQSYVLSMIAEDVLCLCQAASSPPIQEGPQLKGPVVLANIEDDCHPLGRKIVSTLLKIKQWEVFDLGIDVEAEAIVEKAINTGSRVVGVSAMIFSTAENIIKVRREINDRGFENKIKLAAGGAVFRLRPELSAIVGADGTAPNAFCAIALFEKLWRKAERW